MSLVAVAPALQTLFADLAQQVETAPLPGSVYQRSLDGGDYLYAKTPVGAVRVDVFLGKADDPRALAKADDLAAAWRWLESAER